MQGKGNQASKKKKKRIVKHEQVHSESHLPQTQTNFSLLISLYLKIKSTLTVTNVPLWVNSGKSCECVGTGGYMGTLCTFCLVCSEPKTALKKESKKVSK